MSLKALERCTRDLTGRYVLSSLATLWTHEVVEYSWVDGAEGLLRELCHFIAATPKERDLYNLGLGWTQQATRREYTTVALEILLADAADFDLWTFSHAERGVFGRFNEVGHGREEHHPFLVYAVEALARFEAELPNPKDRLRPS